YARWKKEQAGREQAIRRVTLKALNEEIMQRLTQPVPPDFIRTFEGARRRYWNARQAYSNYLLKHDMNLWRMLMPCDPVITVADDVVFFECFSADESSYGCLTIERGDGFGKSDAVQLGTTNVDYSWELYHHFQSLR